MFETFQHYITPKTALSADELELIKSGSISKRIRKHQYLLQEGDVFRHKVFVVKGCFRLYRVDEAGTEHVLSFATENGWISDRESYTTGQPSKSNIDALEDSEVLIWTKDNFELLKEKIPAVKDFEDDLLAKSFAASQNKVYAAISFTAEEKVQCFLSSFPDIFNRVPMQMIASHLGISRETLSRVRHQLAHK
jgi:CRP-like cAMP-binding protein